MLTPAAACDSFRGMIDETKRLFAERVRVHGGVDAVAARLGCTPAWIYVLQSTANDRSPSLALARQIEDLLAIPMRAWSDDAGTP